jgi:hypothetical protein
MQVPFWLFFLSILFALTWHDMATSFMNRVYPTSTKAFTSIKASSLSGSISSIATSFGIYNKNKQVTSNLQHSQPLTTTPTKMSSQQFLETLKSRRTYYALKKESTISDKKIQEIIRETVLHVPSSFNSQSSRIILLLGEEHNKLWDITKDVLKAIVPAENYPTTEKKLNGFQAAYGTVRCSPLLCWHTVY